MTTQKFKLELAVNTDAALRDIKGFIAAVERLSSQAASNIGSRAQIPTAGAGGQSFFKQAGGSIGIGSQADMLALANALKSVTAQIQKQALPSQQRQLYTPEIGRAHV